MTKKTSVFCVSVLLELFMVCRLAISFSDFEYFDYPPLVYTYSRLSETERECSPLLSSASQLKPDDSRSYRLKKELSFFCGDWKQELGGSPLMPFDESDIPRTSSFHSPPLRLVSFEVKDVNTDHQLQNGVSLQGTMSIGIARNTTLLYDSLSTFHFSPGMSVLKISFEGVYMEMMQKAGDRLLCMLGNTTLPIWKLFDIDSYGLSDMSSSSSTFSSLKHRLLQDDRLLLVLRYPKTFSFTKRAILGELKSLNERGNDKYFDLVHIFSQLGQYSKYEFISENLKSRSCDSNLYQVELEEDGTNSFNHSEFCNSLRHFSADLFTIMPNWRFTGRDNYSGRFGPFVVFEQEIIGDNLSYENVSLVIQNLKCEQETTGFTVNNATRVAAVFRVFPSQQMDQSMATAMSGLSGKTLLVEGTWEASKGQLCMVGCLGVSDAGPEECNYQVSLYFPRSFSIKQRSAVFGSISSFRNEGNLYVPIIFELETRATDLFFNHPRYTRSYLFYNYSKIEPANAFRERNQLLGFFTDVKKLLLTYPALPDGNDIFSRLSALSFDLKILAPGTQVSSCHRQEAEIFVKVEVVSLGPLLGQYHPWLQEDSSPIKGHNEISNSELLNVSLSLTFTEARLGFTEKYNGNISKLSLEGLYDPSVGEMYLIGCRKVLTKRRSSDTERGFDCLIEVKVLYSAKTMRWLINPTAKITITSQRKNGDALYFSPIELQTSMTSYNNYEQDAVFRKVFEQILRNLMMVTAVILILGQYKYTKENVNSVPYISRVMLSFQMVGFGLPLILDTKVLFPEKEFQSPYNFYGYEQLLEVLDFSGKVLVLAAFLLTAILSWQVSKIRQKHNHPPSNDGGVAHDKQVFLVTSAIYALGYLIYCHTYEDIFRNIMTSTIKSDQMMKMWRYKEEEYIGFIQDLFLLPQIIGNILWRTRARPLWKSYYIGFTLKRVLLVFYDCVRDPVLDPYSDETAILSLHLIFTSRALKLVVAVSMIVLTVVIYMQQNQKYHRLVHLQKITAFKFLSSKST